MANPPVPCLARDVAERISKLTVRDIASIITLTSNGKKPGAILEYAQKIHAGESPEIDFTPGAVRPHVVQAWSMVNDESQYHGCYGMSPTEAATLRQRLLTDKDAGIAEVYAIVQRALARKKSPRPIRVEATGIPATIPEPTVASPSGSNPDLSALLAITSAEPGRYGSYSFNAVDLFVGDVRFYQVSLGRNLYIRARNKRLALLAAKVTSVFGRKHPPIEKYCLAIFGERCYFKHQIPDTVWDGRSYPHSEILPDLPEPEEQLEDEA